MVILVNALSIHDSGGIRVFEKFLNECLLSENIYIIICNDNVNMKNLLKLYSSFEKFKYKIIKTRGFLYRLYFENVKFKGIVSSENVELIYNFSGTIQPFLQIPQLLKIQNLVFYSKKLDKVYSQDGNFFLWLKQIYFRRFVFIFMLNRSSFIEIQSEHVKEYMNDFIEINNKTFYIKSDIDVGKNLFIEPKRYDFNNKIKFLYIVGPHFEYIHKNFIDFTKVMLELNKLNIDFEINITLTKEQLVKSDLWDNILNDKTNFLGYISNEKEMDKLFCDNTILISTSIIETLGLHVIEAIKKGVVPIAPSERYSYSVYGENIITYDLLDTESLLNLILSIIGNKIDITNNILTLQDDLKINEKKKYKSILDIFKKVIDVQK